MANNAICTSHCAKCCIHVTLLTERSLHHVAPGDMCYFLCRVGVVCFFLFLCPCLLLLLLLSLFVHLCLCLFMCLRLRLCLRLQLCVCVCVCMCVRVQYIHVSSGHGRATVAGSQNESYHTYERVRSHIPKKKGSCQHWQRQSKCHLTRLFFMASICSG